MSNNIRITASINDKASGPVDGLRDKINKLQKAGGKGLAIGAGAAITAKGLSLVGNAMGAVTDAVGLGISEFIEADRVMGQTGARLKSTGGAANITADAVAKLAGKIQGMTGLDAEAVQEGQNLLLTFTKIRNEVGAGNNIFDRATQTMTDMSVALGTDASSAALQLGKALNDPIRGVTALQRAGVQLSDQQREQIRVFVESGKILEAQKIILAELETQVGGAAEAYGNTMAGKLEKAKRAWEDFTSTIVGNVVTQVENLDAAGQGLGRFVMEQKLSYGELGASVEAAAERIGIFPDVMRDKVLARMRETGEHFGLAMFNIEAEAKVAALGITEGMSEGVRFGAEAIRRGGPVVAIEAGKVANMFPSEIRAKVEDARQAGRDQVLGMAAGIIDAQNDPLIAIEALNKVMDESMSDAERIARLTGKDTMKALRAGLGSSLVADRVAAEEALRPIIDSLNSLGPEGRAAGKALMEELGASILRNAPTATEAMRRAAGGVVANLPFSEPKDPRSPFRGITKWNPLRTVIDNIAASKGEFTSATQIAMSGMKLGGLQTQAVRALSAGVGSGGGGFARGGDTYNVNVTVNSHSLIPGTAADQRRIGDATASATINALQSRGYLPRHPSF